jgi:hypothetical protein
MESFTLRWPRVRVLSGLGQNGLLRISDRVESIATVLVILIAVIALPVAAAVGTSAYGRMSMADVEYAASIHQTEASVVGVGRPEVAAIYEVEYSTSVQWNAGGRSHAATVEWTERVRAGDHIMVWVNDDGDLAQAPAPVDQAARYSIATAIVLWSAVVGLSAGALCLLRWRLDVGRLANWERELETLADDGSRH